MTVYKNIKGDRIETVATDPSNPIEGDIWYNTTSGIIKGLGFRAAAWASGANLNTGRQRAGSAGTAQTAALAFGGFEAPPNGPPLGETETYNGTSWSEGPDLNTSRGNTSGSGTTTAAWCGAGRGTPSGPFVQNTEEYDGSSWTNSNTSNSSDAAIRSCSGTQTAGLMAGGFAPPSNNPIEHNNNVEEYNGTSWTNVTVLPQYQAYNCQAGTQTATINGGGNAGSTAPSVSDNAISLEYDGTNWTTGPNANIAPSKFDAYQGVLEHKHQQFLWVEVQQQLLLTMELHLPLQHHYQELDQIHKVQQIHHLRMVYYLVVILYQLQVLPLLN